MRETPSSATFLVLLVDTIGTLVKCAGNTARIAEGLDSFDDQVLRDLHLVSETVKTATRTAVDHARRSGVSWQRIGEQLDMTRQAAQQRFGEDQTPPPPLREESPKSLTRQGRSRA